MFQTIQKHYFPWEGITTFVLSYFENLLHLQKNAMLQTKGLEEKLKKA